MNGPGYFEEGLVYGDPLHQGGEVTHDVDHLIAQALILGEVAAHEPELGAQLPGPASRHTAPDPECFGFVRGGQYHTTSDGDRYALQRRIQELLDRRIEGVEIGVEDGGPGSHMQTIVEHMFACRLDHASRGADWADLAAQTDSLGCGVLSGSAGQNK